VEECRCEDNRGPAVRIEPFTHWTIESFEAQSTMSNWFNVSMV
jgi:hypothetical protein